MFYPANLLCRGGRLHMVWMAEYCPAKIREIRKVQMEKVDFVQLCEYICQVIKNESGSSKSRFSLRLSSKLMRGLVRLYQRKMLILVGDLFVMHAEMLKVMYHKAAATTVHPTTHRRAKKRPKKERSFAEEDQPSEEENVEERLMNSIVLARNNEITLRECDIPVMRLPMNDFGDEGPAAVTELLGEQTVEQMMARDNMSALATSAREFPTSPHTSHVPDPALAGVGTMDTLPELNVTLFDKATANAEIPVEIQEIPRISEILPNIPGPAEEKQHQEELIQSEEHEDEFELEVLSDVDKYTKYRHKKHHKVVDREHGKILDTNYMRSRIDDDYVDLRCKTAEEDVIDFKWVPAELHLRRPAWSGPGHQCCVSKTLYALYDRNLVTHKPATPERRQRLQERRRTSGERPPLTTEQQHMEVIQEQQPQVTEQQVEIIEQQQVEIIEQQQQVEVIEQQQVEVIEQQPMQIEQAEQPMPANVSDMPAVLSVVNRTATDVDYVPPAKIQRLDVSDNADISAACRASRSLRKALRSSGVLETPQGTSRRHKVSSGGSETPLGSIDRTQVCLNAFEAVTPSGQLLMDTWGTEGTIVNFFNIARQDLGHRIDVRALYEQGPKVPGKSKAVTVAKIFSSLLRLKQFQCVILEKDKSSLEITNIKVGPKLADMI